jgi:hypothetical protein
MRLCVIVLVGLAITGASLAIALAERNDPTREGTSSRLQASPELLAVLSLSPLPVTRWSLVPTNSAQATSNLWGHSQKPRRFARNDQAGVLPGVYESEPYKCIVVVPGAQWDDRCLFPGSDVSVPMPVHKPELRLVPRRK